MTLLRRPRRLLLLVTLTALWCGLWGDVNPANVMAGLAIGIVVLATGVGTPGAGGIRLIPMVRLMWVVTVDLIKSTASVGVEIVRRRDHTEESIVAVRVPPQSRDHLLLLIVAITLTPGTAVVDADPDTGTLYLHLLHDRRREATVAHVAELSRLACEALPVSKKVHIR